MDHCKGAIFCVVHLIWEGMEKGHIDHTNTMALPQRVGGYSFSFKKKKKKMSVRSDLWYAEQIVLDNTFVFEPCFWANVTEERKRSFCPFTLFSQNREDKH